MIDCLTKWRTEWYYVYWAVINNRSNVLKSVEQIAYSIDFDLFDLARVVVEKLLWAVDAAAN